MGCPPFPFLLYQWFRKKGIIYIMDEAEIIPLMNFGAQPEGMETAFVRFGIGEDRCNRPDRFNVLTPFPGTIPVIQDHRDPADPRLMISSDQ